VFEHTGTPSGFYKARVTFWGDPIRADSHGWKVTLKGGTVYVFPHAESPLQAIRDRHGNEIRLTWSPLNLLQRVTSPNGRWLAFTYGVGNRVSQVTDNIGRTVGYTYDASGRLSTVS
jgi:YD repeat-containing protein